MVIADDQALVRAGFRKLLEVDSEIEVIAEAGDGLEAVEAAAGRGADGHSHARR